MNDAFYEKAVQPYSWFAACFLFLSYIIGLWFTLRTHAALIWAAELEDKKATTTAVHTPELHESRRLAAQGGSTTGASYDSTSNSIRESQLYKRILGESLYQVGLAVGDGTVKSHPPPRTEEGDTNTKDKRSMVDVENEDLYRHVTEVAAAVAAAAAREGTQSRKGTQSAPYQRTPNPGPIRHPSVIQEDPDEIGLSGHASGGHDAPNWSRGKSSVILLVATVLYAVIAEILVNTVDVVLESVDIDEKFLGITLFALVPNTTEFLVGGVPLLTCAYELTCFSIECDFVCHEWEYCAVDGNWIRLCLAGLSFADSGSHLLQCGAFAIPRSGQSGRSYFQVCVLFFFFFLGTLFSLSFSPFLPR